MSKRNKEEFFVIMLKGIIIGFAGILPGASGGVLAVATGIYERTLNAVTGFFKDIKGNLSFLLPLIIGSLIGLLPMSFLMKFLLSSYEATVTYCLIGLVLGGVPSFIREANSKDGFKKRYLIGTLAGIAFAVCLFFIEDIFVSGNPLPFNAWTAMLCGGMIGMGIVIPGISSSFILMFLGLYEPLLAALNTFNIPMLFFALLGGLAVAGLLLLFIKKMLSKYHGATYYTTFGLLLGTVVLIFPGFEWSLMQILNTFLLVLGFFASFFMDKFDTKDI